MVDKKDDAVIEIPNLQKSVQTLKLIGTTPLIMNTMSAKTRQGLLLPQKKNKLEKETTAKHHPFDEFKGALHRYPENHEGPTRLMFPAAGFKRAIAGCATDLDKTVSKAALGRLMWINGDCVDIFGAPQIILGMMKQAGMNGAPDVRTRGILPTWCCEITITYVEPNITEQTIVRCAYAAGLIRGLGDSRPEKGHGTFGQWDLVSEKDTDLLALWEKIREEGGREVQDAAIANPERYNVETSELLDWWEIEYKRRFTAEKKMLTAEAAKVTAELEKV